MVLVQAAQGPGISQLAQVRVARLNSVERNGHGYFINISINYRNNKYFKFGKKNVSRFCYMPESELWRLIGNASIPARWTRPWP